MAWTFILPAYWHSPTYFLLPNPHISTLTTCHDSLHLQFPGHLPVCLDPCNVLNAPPPFYIWVISLLNHEPLLQEPPPLECLTRKFKSRLFILPLSPQTAYAYSSVTWHWNLGLTYLFSSFNSKRNGKGYAHNFGLYYIAQCWVQRMTSFSIY